MKSLIIKTLVLVFLLPFFAIGQTDLKIDVSPENIDKVFADWDKADHTGIAIGVVSNGKIVYTKGYGSADLENNIPVTPSTKFLVHSLGSQFTVFGIMLLEERGKLSLQDDIRKYLPELPDYAKKISIENLIHHTSGLNNLEGMKTLAGWEEDDLFTKNQAYGLLKNQKRLIGNPSEKITYSVTNHFLLEKILEKVSGQSIANFAQENIFQPLKMNNTLFLTNTGQIIAQRAKGYNPAGEAFSNMVWNPSSGHPTELYTTVEDMCLWALNFRNPTVGSKNLIQKMDVPLSENGTPITETNLSFYVGQHRYWDYNGTKKLYIVGGGSGYSSKLIRFPDQDLSVVVMANCSPYIGWTSSVVAELYLEKYFNEASTEGATAAIPSKKLSKATLESYCGDYWNKEDFYSRSIYLKNDTLRYSRGENNESPIVAINNNTFQMIANGKVIIQFEKIGDQKMMNVSVNDQAPYKHIAYQSAATWTKDLKPFTGSFFCEALNTTYQISERDGQLIVAHPRIGEVDFRPILKNSFAGNRRYFNEIRFERNNQNVVEGFQFASYGGGIYWFKKIQTKLAKNTKLN